MAGVKVATDNTQSDTPTQASSATNEDPVLARDTPAGEQTTAAAALDGKQTAQATHSPTSPEVQMININSQSIPTIETVPPTAQLRCTSCASLAMGAWGQGNKGMILCHICVAQWKLSRCACDACDYVFKVDEVHCTTCPICGELNDVAYEHIRKKQVWGKALLACAPCLSSSQYHAVCMGKGCVDLIKL